MATAAELPLPGGRDGATVVLHPLRCATVAMPDAWPHGGGMLGPARLVAGVAGVGRTHRAPIVAFLIEHPGAGPLLVDTGFGAAVATDKKSALGPINARVFRGVKMDPAGTIAAQLAARGIAPGDLAAIVMTHLHADHASGLADLEGATALVSEPEWNAARAGDAGRSGYHPALLPGGVDYRLLPFDELDLLGDGSVKLVPTPGHTRGHMSLVVRLGEGEALIAGDAIYTLDNLRAGKRPMLVADGSGYKRSIEWLAAWDREHPGALLIPGHDEDVWAGLEESYR